MAYVDIKRGYRQYSPQELRDYAYSGNISCGTMELGDFLEYIFSDYEQVMYDKIYERVLGELDAWDEEFK